MSDATKSERPGGRRFGRYRVTDVLGSGAMGDVFRAYDELLGRDVAVKTLRAQPGAPDLNMNDERLFREARTIAALGHPNIVRIFDMGIEDEVPYLVMEALPGPTLKGQMQAEPLTNSQMRALGIQIARALDAAHGKGILHRDVKPANVLQAEPGVWKLADFGIAHTPDSSLTLTGQFLGTPMYAAPESVMAGQFSPASDVYGLAATMYEVACGQTVAGPGSGASLAERLTKGVKPPSEIRPGVPRDIERAILRGLSLETSERPTAAEFAEILAKGSSAQLPSLAASAPPRPETAPPPAPRSRVAVTVIGTALLAGAVAAGFVLGRSNTSADDGAQSDKPNPAASSQPKAGANHEPSAQAKTAAATKPIDAGPTVDAPDSGAGVATTGDASVPGLDEAKQLIAAKRREPAIDRLLELRKKYPKDAEVPFLLGNLYFQKQWWTQGFDNYRAAIKNDSAYRENATLINYAIKNLMSPSQSWRGTRFLTQDIGAPAIPHLEKAATSGPGYIRKRAKQVLAKLKR